MTTAEKNASTMAIVMLIFASIIFLTSAIDVMIVTVKGKSFTSEDNIIETRKQTGTIAVLLAMFIIYSMVYAKHNKK